MTQLEMKSILINATKEDTVITEEMIDNVLATNDVNELIPQASSMFSWEKWDKVSNINGANASLVLNRLPFTLPNWNGISILIKEENKVIYFETTDYEKSGWTPITADTRAEELANKKILALGTEVAIQILLAKLRGE